MSGSYDFPFAAGLVSTPVSAGTLLKPDAAVEIGSGFSVANQVAGQVFVGEALEDSNTNALSIPGIAGSFYSQPVKLWFPTYLALVTGGGLVTRGNSLYAITGGFLTVTNPGSAIPTAVCAETRAITPGQLAQVFKAFIN